jgi:hypothetical protein
VNVWEADLGIPPFGGDDYLGTVIFRVDDLLEAQSLVHSVPTGGEVRLSLT